MDKYLVTRKGNKLLYSKIMDPLKVPAAVCTAALDWELQPGESVVINSDGMECCVIWRVEMPRLTMKKYLVTRQNARDGGVMTFTLLDAQVPQKVKLAAEIFVGPGETRIIHEDGYMEHLKEDFSID